VLHAPLPPPLPPLRQLLSPPGVSPPCLTTRCASAAGGAELARQEIRCRQTRFSNARYATRIASHPLCSAPLRCSAGPCARAVSTHTLHARRLLRTCVVFASSRSARQCINTYHFCMPCCVVLWGHCRTGRRDSRHAMHSHGAAVLQSRSKR
jgi:hypothetical protein